MDYLGDIEFFSRIWEQFLQYLNTQPPWTIYIFLFIGALMENIIPPIPGDTLIVFGAYLAGVGIIATLPAYLAMWVGSAVGCLLVYGLSYWKGHTFFKRLNTRFFSEQNLGLAQKWFSKYGYRIVIFNRFLPTARAFVGIVAGMSKMHPVRMTIYVFIGTFLWNSLLVYFGLKVGENWRLVIDVLHTYNRVILALMVAGVLGYLIWRWCKKASGDEDHPSGESERVDRQA